MDDFELFRRCQELLRESNGVIFCFQLVSIRLEIALVNGVVFENVRVEHYAAR